MVKWFYFITFVFKTLKHGKFISRFVGLYQRKRNTFWLDAYTPGFLRRGFISVIYSLGRLLGPEIVERFKRNRRLQRMGVITDICTFFGCGRKLTTLEKLCGNKCIDHQNEIETISMNVKKKKPEDVVKVKPVTLCDGCGKIITGKPYPAYDENFKIQRGIKYCGECFVTP